MPGAHGLLVRQNFFLGGGGQISCIMGDVQVAYGIDKRDENWAELTFAMTSGTVTADRAKKIGH